MTTQRPAGEFELIATVLLIGSAVVLAKSSLARAWLPRAGHASSVQIQTVRRGDGAVSSDVVQPFLPGGLAFDRAEHLYVTAPYVNQLVRVDGISGAGRVVLGGAITDLHHFKISSDPGALPWTPVVVFTSPTATMIASSVSMT